MGQSEGPPSAPAESLILVIDDEEMTRSTIRNMLEASGYAVEEEADGQAGIEAIRRLRPVMVICDVQMPKVNGLEVLRTLREQHPELRHISFLFLSGYSDVNVVKAAYKIGADDFVTKPVNMEVLRMKIASILRRVQDAGVQAATGGAAPGKQSQALSPFEQRLAKLLSRPGGSAGRLRLISLAEIGQVFGEEWTKLREKALFIAEAEIRKNIDAHDTLVRYGEDAFLLLFQDLDEAKASVKVEMIASAIRTRLLGDRAAAYGNVAIVADAVDPRTLAGPDGRLSPQALEDAFRKREADTAARDREEIKGGQAPVDVAQVFRAQINLRFRPLWNPARSMVVAYQCYPVRKTAFGVLSGRAVLLGGAGDAMAPVLDWVLLEKTVSFLKRSAAEIGETLLSLPLHFQTLAAERSDELSRILADVPADLLKSRLMAEIVDVPEHRGTDTILRALNFLKTFARNISVEIPSDDRHLEVFRQGGAPMVQLDIDRDWERLDADTVIRKIGKFGRTAEERKVPARINGINTIDSFKTAMRHDFKLMCGQTVGAIVEAPLAPFQFAASRIAG